MITKRKKKSGSPPRKGVHGLGRVGLEVFFFFFLSPTLSGWKILHLISIICVKTNPTQPKWISGLCLLIYIYIYIFSFFFFFFFFKNNNNNKIKNKHKALHISYLVKNWTFVNYLNIFFKYIITSHIIYLNYIPNFQINQN